jgi:4-carboxymuconolactone decarboxylase
MKLGVAMLAAFVLLAFSMTTTAQDRMPPIPADKMTDAQKGAAAQFLANRKQEVFGPFAALLRSPEVMLRAMAMGDYLRYRSVLPPRLNELVILVTARHWTQQFEWSAHYRAGLAAGLNPEIIKAVADGRRPDGMTEDEAIVFDFSMELLHNKSVSDPMYARALEKFGEQGIIDMVGVVGYYSFLSLVMNTARTPAPANTTVPPLAPFPK